LRARVSTIPSFPADAARPEAEFRLGTLLSRVSADFLNARDHLVVAFHTHPDPRRRAQAYDELKRIDAHLRATLFSRRPPGKTD
jgi:hypothetical protein